MTYKKELIFATQNENKVEEIQQQLKSDYVIKSLKDFQYNTELEETQDSLEGNAQQKASFIYQKFNSNCFADDTGLEVFALDKAPGVDTAIYAGEEKNADKNNQKLLKELSGKISGKNSRNAQFRTVIVLIMNAKEYQFEGVCKGSITEEQHGEKGFGYDPIFKPKGYDQTFAEMTMEEKNKISHRGQAVKKLIDFLNNYS